MKPLVLLIALSMTSSAWAQGKPKAAPVDPCAPIGRTADGRFVYSLQCETLPAPVAPSRANAGVSQSAASQSVAPAEEEDKGGLFRNPFPSLVRPSSDERSSGVGPSTGGR